MKKIYLLLGALVITCTSFAQTISNAGFETWRTTSSGTISPLYAPTDWYGFDSLFINGEQTYVPLFLFPGYTPTDLHAQVFQETTIFHGGASSAKIISLKQDTLGIFAGAISNAEPSFNIAALTGGGGIADAISFTGGTPTTLRITTVSAWVEYFPGKDSITGVFGGNDSGTISVQAIGTIAGIDTVVGTGVVNIGPHATFTQITANVVYTDTVDFVNTVRIVIGSGQLTSSLDSSILYVDDVTMTGIPQIAAVNNVPKNNDLVKVYPNPATGMIHLDGPQNAGLSCELLSVSGQVVRTVKLKGNDAIDVGNLPDGLYMYTISDAGGNKVQRGKVTVSN